MKKDKRKKPCGLRAISIAIHKIAPRKKNNKKKVKSDNGGELWIETAIKKPGALRKALKVEKGKKIPAKKLKEASRKGGITGKRARLAITLRKLNKKRNSLRKYR